MATTRAESVTPLDDPAPPWSVRVKRGSVTAIGRALPPASAALLAGLLLGDRTELLRDIDDAFRRAGVYHVGPVSAGRRRVAGRHCAHGGRGVGDLGESPGLRRRR